MNVVQTAGPKYKQCEGNHESVDCNEGSPFVQLVDDVNYTHNFSNNNTIKILTLTNLTEISNQHMERTDRTL